MSRAGGVPEPGPWFDATGPVPDASTAGPEPDLVRPFTRAHGSQGSVPGSDTAGLDRRDRRDPLGASYHDGNGFEPRDPASGSRFHSSFEERHPAAPDPAVPDLTDPDLTAPDPAGLPADTTRWYDADAGPLVRLYALTRGRARPRHEVFDLIAVISVRPDRAHYRHDPSLAPEHAAVLELSSQAPRSVADLAADCDLPLGVTRVILSDLLEVGLIQVSRPAPPDRFPDERMLREVIDGLRAL